MANQINVEIVEIYDSLIKALRRNVRKSCCFIDKMMGIRPDNILCLSMVQLVVFVSSGLQF